MPTRPATLGAGGGSGLRALAHPVRLGMTRQLAKRPKTCACDFTDVSAASQPATSQHLKVLREAGLVRTQRSGTQICYSTGNAACARSVTKLPQGQSTVIS